jgi:cytochrome c biogenesis protein CcmG, thiol:disulfide interchange protein DsbE
MKKLIFVLLVLISASFAEEPAKDFTLPNIKGENYTLSKNLNKGPILINFWATWCLPCKAEMNAYKKIYKKYKDKGLQVVSISVDDPRTVSKVKSAVRTNRYPFTILLDTNSEVFQLYQGTNPPLALIFDKDGKNVYSHTGYRKGDEKKVEEIIANLLK